MLNRHDFSIEGTFHAQAENGLLGVRRVRTLPNIYIYVGSLKFDPYPYLLRHPCDIDTV